MMGGYMKGGASFRARLFGFLVFIGLLLLIHQSEATAANCSNDSDCGWQGNCNGTFCFCGAGFTLHPDGKPCRNETCISPDCLQCTSPDFCSKCISFIDKSTGECLETCDGSANVEDDDYVCKATEDDDDDDETIIIAVVAGVGAGAVLCIIIIIIVCIYIRKTRRNINLQNHIYSGGHMDSGNVKKFAVYDNNAYENDMPGLDYRLGKKIDPLEYQTELERLRPHMDTLMSILSETRAKTRAMKETDPRLPTYKGVIHQLCRVLVLLHKKDPVHSLPSDALSLVQWGHQMVEDARQQEMPASDLTLDFPTAQISSVDMEDDSPGPTSPVYATPDGSADMGFALPFNAQATPYHSVPVVPYAQSQVEVTNAAAAAPEGQNYQTASRRPGFATISRTPSIPNGTILQNLEFSQPSERTAAIADNRAVQAQIVAASASPPQQAPHYPAQTAKTVEPDVIHQPVKRLTKEDFRSLLISNRASPNTTAQNKVSVVDDLDGETVITGGSWDAEIDTEQEAVNQNDSTAQEEGHFNTFGRSNKLSRMYTDNDGNGSPPVLRGNKSKAASSRPISTPNIQYIFATPPASGDGGSPAIHRNTSVPGLASRPVSETYSVPHKPPKPQPPPKKNIITNSLLGKKSKQTANTNPITNKTTCPTSTGYFANGHFYDPNPMPSNVVDSEVYAPGSNYSDRSNAMSTFLGDMPRSRSVSTSNNSEGNDSENSGGDLDVFPFDPNEATDPVEV